MADRKDRFGMLGKYKKLSIDRGYGDPGLNFNKEQWAADALLESYEIQEISAALDYYFKVSDSPSWKFFSFNCDRIIASMKAQELDKKQREERRALAKEWLNNG